VLMGYFRCVFVLHIANFFRAQKIVSTWFYSIFNLYFSHNQGTFVAMNEYYCPQNFLFFSKSPFFYNLLDSKVLVLLLSSYHAHAAAWLSLKYLLTSCSLYSETSCSLNFLLRKAAKAFFAFAKAAVW